MTKRSRGRRIAPRITRPGYRSPSVAELEAKDAPPGQVALGELPHLFVDHDVTRRKRYQLITDHAGDTVWKDRLVGPCLEWLHNEGWKEYVVHTENKIFRVTATVITEDKD